MRFWRCGVIAWQHTLNYSRVAKKQLQSHLLELKLEYNTGRKWNDSQTQIHSHKCKMMSVEFVCIFNVIPVFSFQTIKRAAFPVDKLEKFFSDIEMCLFIKRLKTVYYSLFRVLDDSFSLSFRNEQWASIHFRFDGIQQHQKIALSISVKLFLHSYFIIEIIIL